MQKTTLKIDGMVCSMCESHINDCIRNQFPVKSVKSSHAKNETVILSEEGVNEAELRAAIEATGYRVLSAQTEEYRKKGLFSVFAKRGG